jgi:hypothetical protein
MEVMVDINRLATVCDYLKPEVCLTIKLDRMYQLCTGFLELPSPFQQPNFPRAAFAFRSWQTVSGPATLV